MLKILMILVDIKINYKLLKLLVYDNFTLKIFSIEINSWIKGHYIYRGKNVLFSLQIPFISN